MHFGWPTFKQEPWGRQDFKSGGKWEAGKSFGEDCYYKFKTFVQERELGEGRGINAMTGGCMPYAPRGGATKLKPPRVWLLKGDLWKSVVQK